jgi:urease accessory protein
LPDPLTRLLLEDSFMSFPFSRLPFLRLAATVLAAAAPAAVWAHAGTDGGTHHGLASGFLHPLTGMDHLAAMVAVGLWSALVAPRAGLASTLRVPLAFAALLLAGAVMAGAGWQFPVVEPAIAASLLVLGLLVARRQALPQGAAVALVGGFALFHGAAHGNELGQGWALAGMVLATVLLHGTGWLLGHVLRGRGPWLPRLAGGATAALGAALLIA